MVQCGFQDAFEAVQQGARLVEDEVRAAWQHPVVRLSIIVPAAAPGSLTKGKLATLQASLSGKKPRVAPATPAAAPSPAGEHKL